LIKTNGGKLVVEAQSWKDYLGCINAMHETQSNEIVYYLSREGHGMAGYRRPETAASVVAAEIKRGVNVLIGASGGGSEKLRNIQALLREVENLLRNSN